MQQIALALLFFSLHFNFIFAQNILRIAVTQNAGIMNPQGYSFNQMYAQNMIYEGLVKTDKQGNIIPSLASSWEIRDSGKTYVFYLRKNVVFSNGEAFNAYAVAKNFDSILKNRLRHSWSALATLIDEVKVLDEFSISLHLKQPYIATLNELSLVRPFRFLAPSMFPDDLDLVKHNPKKPIGTGPYMLIDTQVGISDTFQKNPNYWDKESYHGIYFDQIVAKVIIEPNSKLIALRANTIDLIYGFDEIPIEIFKDIAKFKQLQAFLSPPIFTTALALNPQNSFLHDEEMRYAIALGIQKTKLIESVYYGFQNEASYLFAQNIPFATKVQHNAPHYNKEKAKELIQNKGYELQKDGYFYKDSKKLSLTLHFIANNPTQKSLAQILQMQFKDIGIFLQLVPSEQTIYRNKQLQGDFDICFTQTWGVPYDVLTTLNAMRHVGHVDYVIQKRLPIKTTLDQNIENIIMTNYHALSVKEKDLFVQKVANLLDLLYDARLYIPLTYERNKAIARKNIKGIDLGVHVFEIPFWEFYKE